jgi:hypothetical protein
MCASARPFSLSRAPAYAIAPARRIDVARDAMADPTRVLPVGGWVRARWGGNMTREN